MKSSGWTHGTARTASFADLVRSRLLGKEGLILGGAGLVHSPSLWQAVRGLFSPATDSESAARQFLAVYRPWRRGMNRFIRANHFIHLMTVAPAGRGKSVSVLVPNLLSYPQSCVCTDPKGELFTITSEHRRIRLGNRIIRLDPFGLCGPGADRFNPLDFIDPNAIDFLDQCRDLANMLVVRTGHESDPHWPDWAEIVIASLIAYICACEEKPAERNLGLVREILACRDSYTRAVETMKKDASPNIRRLGDVLSNSQDKELGSVLTTIQRFTQFLDSPAVAASTSSTSFEPRWLRSGRATVYLILPHDKLVTLAPLMRLWVGMLLRTVTRGLPDERNPVLFLLDEAGHLGKIQVLEEAVTLLRGMGVRLWFFFQSVTQLQTCFGDKAATILDNIETQQYFGINSNYVAEELSKRIGDVTISTTTRSDSTSYSRPVPADGRQAGNETTGTSFSYADTGRRLLKPEELMLLPDDVALIFHRNVPVIPSVLVKYFEAEEFKDGGTGKQTGLGVKAGLAAAALLLAAGYVASLAANLPVPQSVPHIHTRPQNGPWRFEGDRPEGGGVDVPPPVRPVRTTITLD